MFLNSKSKETDYKSAPSTNDTMPQSFDPLIHGTNSVILSLLDKTEMQLLSPIEMISQYQLAPLCGEITLGGFNTAQSEGMPSFSSLTSNKCYPLEIIIENYTRFNDSPIEIDVEQQYQHAFCQINILLINLTRAKQLGQNNNLNNETIQLLLEQINGTIQIYYLTLLLGKHIHPNFEALNQMDEQIKEDTIDAIYTHLSFEKLLDRIIEEKIDIYSIYCNPTAEALSTVEQLLKLPEHSIILSGMGCVPKQVSLPETNIFTRNCPDYSKIYYCVYEVTYFSFRFSQNCHGYGINFLLMQFAAGDIRQNFFYSLDKELIPIIEALYNRYTLLKMVVESDSPAKLSPKNTSYITKPFPLVLICEDQSKLTLFDSFTGEYRANCPLKFGIDIKMIATDSLENKKKLVQYFQNNGIFNMEFILFDQLRQAKLTGKRPSTEPTQPMAFYDFRLFTPPKLREEEMYQSCDINKELFQNAWTPKA